jgi:undecaprenyl pyrophosphate phosphatase UppP
MGGIIILFVIATVVGVMIGIFLADRQRDGSNGVRLICMALVVIGIGFIVAGNNRSGDGFGDLRELFLGSLAIWAALMVGAGYGSTRARQEEDEKRKSGDVHDHRP